MVKMSILPMILIALLCMIITTHGAVTTNAPDNATNSTTSSPTTTTIYTTTGIPTTDPTTDPTEYPTTANPTPETDVPTNNPTYDPTIDPTIDPTMDPTIDPTYDPTIDPTNDPTQEPTTSSPTSTTYSPTENPSETPTQDPTENPSPMPTFDPDATLPPTMEPTKAPTMEPTTIPTPNPTVALSDGESIGFQVSCDLYGVTESFVWENEEILIIVFIDSLGIESNDDNEAAIVEVNAVSKDTERRRRARRLLQDDDSDTIDPNEGVQIVYKIVTSNVDEVNTINAALNDVDSNGQTSFVSGYSEGITAVDEDIEFDEDSVIVEEVGIVEADDFLEKDVETFGELIASPFILLGIVMTIVGIVWLFFLRSDIENKYPSYLALPASNNANNAVEMVPQTSGGQ